VRTIEVNVNGRMVKESVEDNLLLLELLRDRLGLTGVHTGCDTTQCGACTVHLDGKAVKSCTVFAVQVEGSTIVTIEGICENGELHPMQKAFKECHGLQCGYCTPGMIMAGIDIIRKHGRELDERTVREELEGNLCRCTGYQNIVEAVLSVARDAAHD